MRLVKYLGIPSLLVTLFFGVTSAGSPNSASASGASIPHYNHIFVIVEENHGFIQIIGNSAAPVINSLAKTYGLATDYTGVADPSAPNYVALIGGNLHRLFSRAR